MSYQDILGEINGDLAYVEKELHRHARSSPTLLGESSECLVQAGGKRLRPAFVLLSGKFFKYDLQIIGQLAVAIELIHMATLVHDDVIDSAATRRGLPTVCSQWGGRNCTSNRELSFRPGPQNRCPIWQPGNHLRSYSSESGDV